MSLFSDVNTWDVGKTLKKVENHEQIPTSRVFISKNRDMVNVFYCLNTTQYNRTQCKTITQHNTTQHNTNATQQNATQCNETQLNATQRDTTQHNTTQCDAKQHNAMRYNIAYFIDEEKGVIWAIPNGHSANKQINKNSLALNS